MRSQATDKFLEKAIDKMFKAVGFEHFDKEFTKQEKWYTLRQWTSQEENEFKNWFISTAQKELRWSKKTSEKEFSYFNLMYGWATKSETQ
jgi:hypothetical protein